MESNRDFAMGNLNGPRDRERMKTILRELTDILNCEIGPTRDPTKWQKVNNNPTLAVILYFFIITEIRNAQTLKVLYL